MSNFSYCENKRKTATIWKDKAGKLTIIATFACLCTTRLIDLMEVEPTWFARRAMFSLSAGVLALNMAARVHSASEALSHHSYTISRLVVRISVIKGTRDFWPIICDKKNTHLHGAKAQKKSPFYF